MRGRGGRRGPNPLSRSYESNGPDVKVRGTAAHIAEKYMQLARDAHASGDPVLAESYLQHAEHYFRVIAASQPQSQPGNGEASQPHRYNGGGRFDSAEDDGDDTEMQEPQRQSGEAAAKPAKEEATVEAEAQQPQGEEPAPAPRRRRRRTNADQAAAAGDGGSEAKANGHDPAPRGDSGANDGTASKEDVNA